VSGDGTNHDISPTGTLATKYDGTPAGTYAISVDDQSGTVVVKAPAAFAISSLSVSPFEVKVGASVTISALVTNNGDSTGTYEVTLKIDNVVVTTKRAPIST